MEDKAASFYRSTRKQYSGATKSGLKSGAPNMPWELRVPFVTIVSACD